MEKLTEKQKKNYLKDSSTCPICQSREVYLSDTWQDIACHYEEWACKDCEKEWVDTYTLTDVELTEIW